MMVGKWLTRYQETGLESLLSDQTTGIPVGTVYFMSEDALKALEQQLHGEGFDLCACAALAQGDFGCGG